MNRLDDSVCLNRQNTGRGAVVAVRAALVLDEPASKYALQGVAKGLPPVVVERRGAVVAVDRCLPVAVAIHAPVHELVALLVAVKDSIPGNEEMFVRNKERMEASGKGDQLCLFLHFRLFEHIFFTLHLTVTLKTRGDGLGSNQRGSTENLRSGTD